MESTNRTYCDIVDQIGKIIIDNPVFIDNPSLKKLVYYPGPTPPSLWTRSYADCVNCQNHYCGTNPDNIYPPPVCNCSSATEHDYISSEQLDMRRKAEIFKYKKNASDQTKNQKYSLLAKGVNIYRKKCWTTQSEYYTNPNVNNLPLNGYTLTCGTNTQSAQNIANCSPTTNNDVPGPVMNICYDNTIPLTNYVVRRIYTFNGTKWPHTSWTPGDNGFPNGKSGNKRFLM